MISSTIIIILLRKRYIRIVTWSSLSGPSNRGRKHLYFRSIGIVEDAEHVNNMCHSVYRSVNKYYILCEYVIYDQLMLFIFTVSIIRL